MPQITCPNGGKTINLKSRREIDCGSIENAVHQKPYIFADLLRVTRLPYKTFSLRIKQLCEMKVLIKRNRFYCYNGMYGVKKVRFSQFPRFSRFFDDNKLRTCSMLLLFILAFSISGYVLAMITPVQKKLVDLAPPILGNFTVSLSIKEIQDLYAWQVVIEFNSSELTVLNVYPGGFFRAGEQFPEILWDAYANRLLVGNTVYPGGTAKSGSGTLAVVIFGYFVEDYTPPKIVNRSFDGFETYLISSNGSRIDVDVNIFHLR